MPKKIKKIQKTKKKEKMDRSTCPNKCHLIFSLELVCFSKTLEKWHSHTELRYWLRRLPQPYQTTTPSRALLSLSGANNVLAIFKTNFFGHCHILSEVLLTFYWLLLTLYWPLLTLYCLSNESTGSIQSYKCDGILRIRRRLPQPYQTTTPSRALLFERC